MRYTRTFHEKGKSEKENPLLFNYCYRVSKLISMRREKINHLHIAVHVLFDQKVPANGSLELFKSNDDYRFTLVAIRIY